MRRATGITLALFGLALASCSVFSRQPAGGPAKPIPLGRCDANPSALCLQSFGLDQNELLITFYFPAAGEAGFYLKVFQPGLVTMYPCTVATTSDSTMYCRGPLINLGTLIQIDLYTSKGTEPLAEGSFTLTDLALPTLAVAGIPTTPAPGTPVTAPSTPLTGVPATPAGATPAPGTAYPNPIPP